MRLLFLMSRLRCTKPAARLADALLPHAGSHRTAPALHCMFQGLVLFLQSNFKGLASIDCPSPSDGRRLLLQCAMVSAGAQHSQGRSPALDHCKPAVGATSLASPASVPGCRTPCCLQSSGVMSCSCDGHHLLQALDVLRPDGDVCVPGWATGGCVHCAMSLSRAF